MKKQFFLDLLKYTFPDVECKELFDHIVEKDNILQYDLPNDMVIWSYFFDKSDEELSPEEDVWLEKNTHYSAIWPNITKNKGALPEADEWADKNGKTEQFSEKAGSGDA